MITSLNSLQALRSILNQSQEQEIAPFNYSEIQELHNLGWSVTNKLEANLNKKQVALAILDLNKKKVANGKYYVTYFDGGEEAPVHVIVSMYHNAFVYKLNADSYDVEVTEDGSNILVIDLKTGHQTLLLYYGELVWGNVKALTGLTRSSGYTDKDTGFVFKGYPAIRLSGSSYKHSVRHHAIIATMFWGFEKVMVCVGEGRTSEIDHIESYVLTENNSIENLQILTTEVHANKHKRNKNIKR